jgi:hypothetical protein
MEVQYLKEPFPHIIIQNQFTDEELVDVWRELKFLNNSDKLNEPESTGGAFNYDQDGNKIILKNNKGLWVDHVYTNRKYSDILRTTRKIFSPEFTVKAAEFDWMFRYLKYCNADTTLVSYYEEGGYYKPHPDMCVLTAITHLFNEPKNFTGGELTFTDHNYDVGLVNNRTIIFPSVIFHEVSDIKMTNNVEYGGRYAISQFIKIG